MSSFECLPGSMKPWCSVSANTLEAVNSRIDPEENTFQQQLRLTQFTLFLLQTKAENFVMKSDFTRKVWYFRLCFSTDLDVEYLWYSIIQNIANIYINVFNLCL